ncbi:hypothetical protein AYI68_g6450 [Smittium mucronatum]|uniref:Uncharacterized protein n=1 Tax=Smittium mucronatum TaxID=133383 RepID=A0A1R0GRH7_9FUNG|nr:hypothetical protein AYI68_g6450 [Smittium mucronatum]
MPWIGDTNFEEISQLNINLKLDCVEISDSVGLGNINISGIDEVIEHDKDPKESDIPEYESHERNESLENHCLDVSDELQIFKKKIERTLMLIDKGLSVISKHDQIESISSMHLSENFHKGFHLFQKKFENHDGSF